MGIAVRYIRQLCKQVLLKNSQESRKLRLFKGAAGVFLLRITYTGLTFITGVLLARVLGVLGFGIYNYALTWTLTLGLIANVGFDNLIVREIATYSAQSAWGSVRGMLRYANQVVLFLSIALALVAIAIAWKIGIAGNNQMFSAFCAAMVTLPIVALRNLTRGAIKGFSRVTLSLVPELLFAPILLIVLVGGFYLLLPQQLTATWVMIFYGVSALVTLGMGVMMLNRVLPVEAKTAKRSYQIKAWIHSALPFIFLEGLYALNAQVDILMLGALRGVEAAGVYVPVSRGANLIVFALMAVVNVLAPVQASLYTQGKRQELQSLVTRSTGGVFLASLAIALPLIVFGHWYLMLFGAAFTQGQRALTILCLGQVAASVTGLAGPLLNMTGYERYTLISVAVGGGLNIVLNTYLIPLWGIEGAALATSASILCGNITNIVWVSKKLGIHSSPW
ncbi:flippase [Leptolyngbya sp. AN03gr2]|uniref:flippase n=1 Tax=unclassified Leptolyngbya TaxID=2650499 RepID=UPI003D318242